MYNKKFELRKASVEVRNKNDITEGCTITDESPQLIKAFDNKDDALKELKAYKTEVIKLSGGAGTYYDVTEYYVEENEYDEDDTFISGGDVWGYSK